MKAIVVGYGSIGQRHARLLSSMGLEVAVVSGRNVDFPIVYPQLAAALDAFKADYVVIANKSSEHHASLLQLAAHSWQGIVLVEKPLYHTTKDLPDNHGLRIVVAYNLRFHPLLLKLREALQQERLLSIAIYAGQYLPDWRPDRDYRHSYSSSKEEGGGVLRDLSHELDYLNWLCGNWRRLSAIGGKFSSLEITGDDLCGILLEMERCPVATVQVNYLDRPGRREIVVVTDRHTYAIDFSNGLLYEDGQAESVKAERDFTYLSQHSAIVNGQWDNLCSYEEGQQVVRMIDAIERSISSREWISNG